MSCCVRQGDQGKYDQPLQLSRANSPTLLSANCTCQCQLCFRLKKLFCQKKNFYEPTFFFFLAFPLFENFLENQLLRKISFCPNASNFFRACLINVEFRVKAILKSSYSHPIITILLSYHGHFVII